jgi:translocator protein
MEAVKGESLRRWGGLVASLVLVFLVAAAGRSVTDSGTGSWYAGLLQPAFAPPSWVFGPVWTALYVAMAVAAWRVWWRGGRDAAPALALYALQLAMNFGWSFLFFGLQENGWALVWIVAYAGVVALTLRAFLRHDRVAGWLLAPLLAWVAFAAALNAGFWVLNR